MKNVNEGRRFLILFLVRKLKGYFSQLLQTAKNQSQCFGAFTDCKTFNFHVFSALYSAQNILIDFLSFLILEKAESTFLSFFILKKLILSFFSAFLTWENSIRVCLSFSSLQKKINPCFWSFLNLDKIESMHLFFENISLLKNSIEAFFTFWARKRKSSYSWVFPACKKITSKFLSLKKTCLRIVS